MDLNNIKKHQVPLTIKELYKTTKFLSKSGIHYKYFIIFVAGVNKSSPQVYIMFMSGVIVVFVGILSTGEIILKNKVIFRIASKMDHQDSIFAICDLF